MRPRIGINRGRMRSITPARSSAAMPRAASARLIERPRSVRARRGSGRRSHKRSAPQPRRISITPSSAPASPAPTMLTGWSESVRKPLPVLRPPSNNFLQHSREALAKGEHVREAIVQRNRGNTDDVGLAPVTDDTELAQPVQYAPAPGAGAGNSYGQLTTSGGGRAGRNKLYRRLERPQQQFQETRQRDGFLPQPLDTGLLKQLQRGQQRCGREDGGIADLPGCSARGGREARLHPEAGRGFMS